MEILGIGPGEFMLILIVLLVAVGPERLPGLARQAGRLLVRGRNWLQSSPDAALILRARQEIEQELATLRSSLLEVQSVRDEVLGAVKQAESSISSIASGKVSLDGVGQIAPPAVSAPETPLLPASGESAPAAFASDSAGAAAPAAFEPEVAAPAEPRAAAQPAVPELRMDQWSVARTPPQPAAPRANGGQPNGALEAIDVRLQAIMADLHALQAQLKQRGVLEEDWRPPSWGVSLPNDPAAPAGAPAPSDPIETEEATS